MTENFALIGVFTVPLLWAALAFLSGPGRGAWLAISGSLVQLFLALIVARSVLVNGPLHHATGGWGAPLGIDLYADGLTAAMLLLTQAVALPVFVYARRYFAAGAPAARHFWPLAGFLIAGMNALYLANDIFNLYVTLEIVGLAAVALIAAGGAAGQVAAALRYLFAALLGSGAYLLGVALIYGTYGTVSIATLTPLIDAAAPRAVSIAALLMFTGLMLKSALFPFHYWLPAAHGGAPAPVSALLSALVVKAAIYLSLRLWLGPFAPLVADAAWVPGVLGAAAILWGSVMAIRTPRLKLLVAYSTVAQLGYLFLAFPLLTPGAAVLGAVTLQAIAHGLAKAAMFAAAGIIIQATGRDAVAEVAGVAERLPLTLSAFALAGVSLMGLPPSGGFLAKWLLLDAALNADNWPMVTVIIAGGLLAAVYVFRVVRLGFLNLPEKPAGRQQHAGRAVPRSLEWMAFGLAAASVLLGLFSFDLLQLIAVGNPS